jgi:hypothetical protein
VRQHDEPVQPYGCSDERRAVLIYSMSVSVDGFITDREGGFGWTVPSKEQFRFSLSQIRELGGYLCGRRLYQTMLPWETDPSMRDNELGAAFADVWCGTAASFRRHPRTRQRGRIRSETPDCVACRHGTEDLQDKSGHGCMYGERQQRDFPPRSPLAAELRPC